MKEPNKYLSIHKWDKSTRNPLLDSISLINFDIVQRGSCLGSALAYDTSSKQAMNLLQGIFSPIVERAEFTLLIHSTKIPIQFYMDEQK